MIGSSRRWMMEMEQGQEQRVNQSTMKHRLITAVLLIISLGATTTWAMGGIELDEASPHFAKGNNRSDFEDLRVKVLGGYVRMNRRWIGAKRQTFG